MKTNKTKVKILKSLLEKEIGKKVTLKEFSKKVAPPVKVKTPPSFQKLVIIKDNKIQKLLPTYPDKSPHDYFPGSIVFNIAAIEGKKVKVPTIWGDVVFSPFYNRRISNFIENAQGPGSTDLAVPLAGKTKDYVLVFVSDFAIGHYLIIVPKNQYNKKQVCEKIIKLSNISEDENDDYDSFGF